MSEPTLEERVEVLEKDVILLKKARPGRKASPVVAPLQAGVCGLDPECDSADCEKSSVYRYQQKCRGTACVDKYSEYFSNYRAKGKENDS